MVKHTIISYGMFFKERYVSLVCSMYFILFVIISMELSV